MDKTFTSPFAPLWNKYRPVLLKLMLDAQTTPQQYQLFEHEVRSLAPKGKSLAFTLRVQHNKPLTKIKDSIIVSDLLHTLSLSKKATELMTQHTYEFTLGRDFRLHVAIIETL
ncbi:MAG TPA: hypothetical protein VFM90_04340 [Cyclobacteriaceae bacterium]|nr:hypothetical protein [Cyclobacteriaceae bacterium]